jgi:hypothetical protein
MSWTTCIVIENGGVKVVVEEVVKRVVVVVVETQWEESQAKPGQENQPTHERSEHRKRKDETHQR